MVTLEEYRSRLVKIRLAYLEVLEGPQLSAANAARNHDQLAAINNDLMQFAEDITREIRDLGQSLTGRSQFPGDPTSGYQRLFLDASTLAQRVAANLRLTNRFVYRTRAW